LGCGNRSQFSNPVAWCDCLCSALSQDAAIASPTPPFLSYFILFATFGGWLMVGLTALFWKWSGMASLGVFSLVLVAPFVTAGAAFSLRSRHTLSGFHRNAYIASVAYSALMLTALGGWLGVHFLLG
jgi:hypothetical protein